MRRNGLLRASNGIQLVLTSAALLAAVIGVPVIAQGRGWSSQASLLVEPASPPVEPASPPVETAFAVPRIGTAAGQDGWRGEVGIVRPLSAADAARVRQVFALQQSGQIEQASRATRSLRDSPLLGDLLADRYLSPDTQPDQQSLRQWLRRWDDLPDAKAIRHRLSDLSHGRNVPASVSEPALDADQPPPEEADPAGQAFERNPLLDRTVQARLERGGARSALQLVAATRHIDPLYAARLRAEIAREMFTSGDDVMALRTARAALRQSGGAIGLAAYVAGLAAWRQGQIAQAQSFFEQASRGALTAAGTRAGAAFWAARAHRRLHDEVAWRAWMGRAAASSYTFYGMLAARLLGQAATPAVMVAENASRRRARRGRYRGGSGHSGRMAGLRAVAGRPAEAGGSRAAAALAARADRRSPVPLDRAGGTGGRHDRIVDAARGHPAGA